MIKTMGKILRFLAALLLGFSIAAEIGWIQITHPVLKQFHGTLYKAVKMLLYLLFPN